MILRGRWDVRCLTYVAIALSFASVLGASCSSPEERPVLMCRVDAESAKFRGVAPGSLVEAGDSGCGGNEQWVCISRGEAVDLAVCTGQPCKWPAASHPGSCAELPAV